ncbi:uncharacterized protein [Epargyreus clarus]|uniref:uncharacterized protein n=1 Tax=Epargyreus clarus TaxID=520877 RepID=UPI003C2F6E9F
MADAELRVLEVLKSIATKLEYRNHKVDLKPISSEGANYTSQLFSITLSAPGKDDLKLFAKVASLGEKMRSMSNLQVFETEIPFYSTVLAKYRELEESHKLPQEDRLVTSKFYGGTAEYMKEVIILEDLVAKGYQSFDRFECMDWEYASKCVSQLARLHALSVAFDKDDPERYSELIEKLEISMPIDPVKDFLSKSIETAIESTEKKYRAKVKKFLRESMSSPTLQKFFRPEKRVILKHGDFRPSNILHKLNRDGKVQPVLVDYQIMQRGTPVTDLLYFLISGSGEEFRANHLDEFFDHYYEEFGKALARFGIDVIEVLPRDVYDADVKELVPFGLTLGAFCLPIVTVDSSKAPKPEDVIDMDKMNVEVSDLFLARFNGLVRDYVRMGIL